MLKPYYYEVQAVKITRENFQRLKKLDVDGVLSEGIEELEGDWFVMTEDGTVQIFPRTIKLIPVTE